MNSKPSLSPLLKVAIGLIVVFCVLAATGFWMTDPLHIRAPSDQKLLTIFRTHRTAFEKLHQMVAEDSQEKWYFTASNTDDQTHDVRRKEYKKLLHEISKSRFGSGVSRRSEFQFFRGGAFYNRS
jgi:hypothetical protein